MARWNPLRTRSHPLKTSKVARAHSITIPVKAGSTSTTWTRSDQHDSSFAALHSDTAVRARQDLRRNDVPSLESWSGHHCAACLVRVRHHSHRYRLRIPNLIVTLIECAEPEGRVIVHPIDATTLICQDLRESLYRSSAARQTEQPLLRKLS